MLQLHEVLILLTLHFIADFILQSNNMATNKSKSNYWLSYHVGVYTLVFSMVNPLYALVNGALHWITDYLTSRVASYFYVKDDRRYFFITIGFDQLVHSITLITTYYLMVYHYEYFIPWFI
jgi:hypothetical protein